MRLGTSSITSTTLAVPPTQNTAPVLEFNCLYTHDIRRKSKRWQDGFLRFHTFNKRIMVYDDSRNFIGDAHWTECELLQEGDEVKLDKNGVLVQVADKIGQTETDLTDLRKSKNKSTANPASSSPLRLSTAISIVNPTNHERQPLQAKHRSLNAMLGSGRKPIGKAILPSKSPYEVRKELACNNEEREWAQQGSSKRRRTSRTEHVSPVSHAPRAASTAPKPRASPTLKKSYRQTGANTTAESSTAKHTPTKNSHKQQVEIDLCSDDEQTQVFSSMLAEPVLQTPKQPPQASKVTVPVQRPSNAETQGKRLSIARTTSKRNMLACHSMVDNDSETRVQQAQKDRFEARLARLQERKTLQAPVAVSDANLKRQKTKSVAKPDKSSVKPPAPASEAVQPIVIEIPSSQPLNNVSNTIGEPYGAEDEVEHQMNIVTNAIDVDHESDTRLELAQDDLAAFDELLSSEIWEESAEVDTHIETEQEAAGTSAVNALDNMQPEEHPSELASAPGAPELSTELAELPRMSQQSEDANGEEVAHPPLDQPELAIDGPVDVSAELGEVPNAQPSTNRRKRVTRSDVRKSASSCFKPPTHAARNIPTKQTALHLKPGIESSSTRTAGAWSREAFDLFTWRPPYWDDDSWALKA